MKLVKKYKKRHKTSTHIILVFLFKGHRYTWHILQPVFQKRDNFSDVLWKTRKTPLELKFTLKGKNLFELTLLTREITFLQVYPFPLIWGLAYSLLHNIFKISFTCN